MGGSDHKIYNDRLVNVPMVFFNVWPDPYYESDLDSPDKCDPTTLRREAVVAVASAVLVSRATGPEALSLASEVYSRGLGRLSQDIKKGFEYLNTAERVKLAEAYKEAEIVVRYSFAREKGAVNTVLGLAPNDAALAKYVSELKLRLDLQQKGAVQDIWNLYLALCERAGLRPETPKLSPDEFAAQRSIPIRNEKLRGPLGMRYVSEKTGISPLTGASRILRDERVIYEVFNFIDGKNSVLDIRNAASAEYSPIPLQEVRNLIENLVKAGVVRIGPRR